jgi:hypothetical protein
MSRLRKINEGIDEIVVTLDASDAPLSTLTALDKRVAELFPELRKMVAKVEEGMKDPDKARGPVHNISSSAAPGHECGRRRSMVRVRAKASSPRTGD